MKKRCTNSACRRVFSLPAESCPHCGKSYPRLPRAKHYYVVLSPTPNVHRARAVLLYRRTVERVSSREVRVRLQTQTHQFGPMCREEAEALRQDWLDAEIPAALKPVW